MNACAVSQRPDGPTVCRTKPLTFFVYNIKISHINRKSVLLLLAYIFSWGFNYVLGTQKYDTVTSALCKKASNFSKVFPSLVFFLSLSKKKNWEIYTWEWAIIFGAFRDALLYIVMSPFKSSIFFFFWTECRSNSLHSFTREEDVYYSGLKPSCFNTVSVLLPAVFMFVNIMVMYFILNHV